MLAVAAWVLSVGHPEVGCHSSPRRPVSVMFGGNAPGAEGSSDGVSSPGSSFSLS